MMSEHNQWDSEPRRKDVWDSKLMLLGGGALMLLMLIGITICCLLRREPVEKIPAIPSEAQPFPIETLLVLLVLACAVGIWLLVILVAMLVWIVWRRLPHPDDTLDPPGKTGKPPPI